MAKNVETPRENMKSTTVTLPAPLFDFVDELQWTERRKRPEILREAVAEYAAARGYVTPVE